MLPKVSRHQGYQRALTRCIQNGEAALKDFVKVAWPSR